VCRRDGRDARGSDFFSSGVIEFSQHHHHTIANITSGRARTLDNNGYKDEIFTKRVRAGKRTYFFDVKSTKSEKDFYITITESKRVGEEEYEKHKIFLYKEDFDKFREALAETIEHVLAELAEHGEPVKQD
jgi:hypothetical protein